jgi:hypothetical protein
LLICRGLESQRADLKLIRWVALHGPAHSRD